MSIVYSLFGRLFTPECGSHAVLPKAEPSPFPEMRAWTTTPVCHIAFDPSCLLRFLTTLDLTPFWDSQKGYWVSSETTTTSKLSYSYPEFNNLTGDSGAIQAAIANYINQQYGGSSFSSLGTAGPAVSFLAQAPADGGAQAPSAPAAAGSVHPFASRGGPQTTAKAQQGKEAPQVVQDWTARIHFKKYELGQSFAVLLFLGEVPADASQWRSSPSFVGAHVAFVNSAADHCANCREQADLVAEGFVHLNTAIAKSSGLSSFEPRVVTPYLRDNLHWRVQAVRSFCVQSPFKNTTHRAFLTRLIGLPSRWIDSLHWRSPWLRSR
jgi:hypothetical protein